jgi:hypothetical protein
MAPLVEQDGKGVAEDRNIVKMRAVEIWIGRHRDG